MRYLSFCLHFLGSLSFLNQCTFMFFTKSGKSSGLYLQVFFAPFSFPFSSGNPNIYMLYATILCAWGIRLGKGKPLSLIQIWPFFRALKLRMVTKNVFHIHKSLQKKQKQKNNMKRKTRKNMYQRLYVSYKTLHISYLTIYTKTLLYFVLEGWFYWFYSNLIWGVKSWTRGSHRWGSLQVSL